jgi:hypothetical protein
MYYYLFTSVLISGLIIVRFRLLRWSMVVSFALGPVPLEERYDIYIFYIRGNSNIPLFVDLFAMVSGSL